MFSKSDTPAAVEEKSLDFLLFCGFLCCMLLALAAHFLFKMGIPGEVAMACGATLVAVILSICNRVKHAWHWPGASVRELFWAFAAALLVAFFIEVALPGRSPLNPNLFPWCAMGAGILLFAVLSGLRVVSASEREFLLQCGPGQAEIPRPPAKPRVRSWRRTVVSAFEIYFLVVWILAVVFFWQFNAVCQRASPVQTATQTEGLSDHGRLVFMTPKEKRRLEALKYSLTTGVPSVFVLGAFLHFVVGVRVFSRRGN